jgi:hypothetical protein
MFLDGIVGAAKRVASSGSPQDGQNRCLPVMLDLHEGHPIYQFVPLTTLLLADSLC